MEHSRSCCLAASASAAAPNGLRKTPQKLDWYDVRHRGVSPVAGFPGGPTRQQKRGPATTAGSVALQRGEPEGVPERPERAERRAALDGGDPDGVDDRADPAGVEGASGRPGARRTGVKQRGGVRARGKPRAAAGAPAGPAGAGRGALAALRGLGTPPAAARMLHGRGESGARARTGLPTGSVGALSDTESFRPGGSCSERVEPP